MKRAMVAVTVGILLGAVGALAGAGQANTHGGTCGPGMDCVVKSLRVTSTTPSAIQNAGGSRIDGGVVALQFGASLNDGGVAIQLNNGAQLRLGSGVTENLYRAGATALKTDASLTVVGNLTTNAGSNSLTASGLSTGAVTCTVASGASAVVVTAGARVCLDGATCADRLTDSAGAVLVSRGLQVGASGTAVAPAITFSSAPDSGVYHYGGGNLAVAVNGSAALVVAAGQTTGTGSLVAGTYTRGTGGNVADLADCAGLSLYGATSYVDDVGNLGAQAHCGRSAWAYEFIPERTWASGTALAANSCESIGALTIAGVTGLETCSVNVYRAIGAGEQWTCFVDVADTLKVKLRRCNLSGSALTAWDAGVGYKLSR